MFSLFRKKPAPVPPTYHQRVLAFWRWFQDAAPRFYRTIEDKKCDTLGPETSAQVDLLGPGFAWVYGPGANGQGHSLTVSGEGVESHQLLALHWLAMAPTIPGWTFYAARQAGPIKGHVIDIAGHRFDPAEIWVTPSIDAKAENIDLTIWHPAWNQIETRIRNTVTYLFLDEALGEYGTEWYIGRLQSGDHRLAESFPLEELATYVQTVAAEHGWKKYPPGEGHTLFSIHPQEIVFPRSDLITVSTAAPRLFRDYLHAKGAMEDPFAGNGADYIYLSIARDYFPAGRETDTRGEIEDALDAALQARHSGRCLGGGMGTEFACVDLLIYDGPSSLALVRETIKSLRLPTGTMIEYFAKEKRTHRIAV